MKAALLSLVLVSTIFSPLTTFAADADLAAYDKQIATLTKKIEVLEKQLAAIRLKRERREAVLENQHEQVSDAAVKSETNLLKIVSGDHVRGNPKAPIVVFVYSDFECPFCQTHHATMQRVLAEYENKEKVVWVHRHYPIVQLHPNAKKIAEASECVANQAGDKGFWKFADTIFGSRAYNSYTDMKKLDGYAVAAGANKKEFQKCMLTKAGARIVSKNQEEVESLGISGTPHTIVIGGGRIVAEISGAQPYTQVIDVIDEMLSKL